jgi:sugar O-acyltransferase (sialic acid O-acetyltransferase NeuD family)
MILYGASGHAKVILDILSAMGITVTQLLDDNEAISDLHGIQVVRPYATTEEVIISIGSNAIRKKIAEANSYRYGVAIHPSAIISPSAKIGEGTVVMQGAIIQADAVIGRHCIVNTASVVEHECVVGDYVHIAPNSSLCGNVSVGEGTWIGAGSTVIPGIEIGEWTVVGAGSTVIRNIESNVVAVGNPCRMIKCNNMNNNKLCKSGGGKITHPCCMTLIPKIYAA